MATASEVLKSVHKEHGQSVATLGAKVMNRPRLPTGILALDIATGGGFPMGKVSIVFGPESSGKTNIVLKAIACGQKLHPDKMAVFIDIENAYDPTWAAQLGVDIDRVIHVQPESAEQAVDLTEAFLYASDVFVVAIDSLAALVTQNEINSSAEKAVVGGSSLSVGKLMRKAVRAQAKAEADTGFAPAMLCVNQIRHKIGVMFGDPETTPGGHAPRFAASMIVRVYGKNVMDKAVHATIPAVKNTSVILRKWKVPIVATTCEYDMQMIATETTAPGEVKEWNTLSTYMKELGYLEKTKTGWVMMGKPYATLNACKDQLDANPLVAIQLKSEIIKELVAKNSKLPVPDHAGDDKALESAE